MKKIASALLLSLLLIACTPDEESYDIEVLPIAKVEMQSAFAKDSVTIIPIKYLRPTTCHFYEDLYYERANYTRTVAVYCSRLNGDNCHAISNDTVEVPLRFKPTELGTYTFKFWKGTNSSGADEFYEYEAIVNH